MYGFHWYSLVGGWISEGDYASEVQFSPADRVLVDRATSLWNGIDVDGTPVTGNVLQQYIWDCSYILSPTTWFDARRYDGYGRPDVDADGPKSLARRNHIYDARFSAGKVLMWERFDWTKRERTETSWFFGFGEPRSTVVGKANLPPNWNNPDAKPSALTVDGSVSRAPVGELYERMADEDPDRADPFTPTDLWIPTDQMLQAYSMDQDGLENGGGENEGAYPAFFWATKNGIQGRDLQR